MQQCSFTEFCNELAWVLRTHQHVISKASTKSVSTKSIEVESGEEDAPSKSQIKKDKKIIAQSSQIKDLQSKLFIYLFIYLWQYKSINVMCYEYL